ncbi:ribosomal L28e protein family-domain-containing protein [Syncephalastrum racemosum]|uniref:Ribosomal L28e protein family-domain-containing protein n=1 Tax=Syncephalastrum racemosum TaxID=13706 RepID=A0A1X2HRF3_SYNRA|nr:ribosomal L28e protein family-domain-containing protein [Syncephalastrum racemosum]
MSSELVWSLVKNNNSFLVKRNNVQFSREAGNLTNLNTFKFSGIAQPKTVSIQAAPKGVQVVTQRTKKQLAPGKANVTTVINNTRRKTAKSVAQLVARNGYRSDLRQAALARASRVKDTQRVTKARAAPVKTGRRAEKKAAKVQA